MNKQQYISDIIICNFQSHKETYLELVPGVNVLVGDSDSGKSAVFRALIWFFDNEPKGDEYRSKWGGDTEVAICLQPDNLWIGRVKGSPPKNYYWIGEDIEKNRLFGFGHGKPPKAVLEILNLGEVNFQAQMTLPFLLSMSSGKAGKFYNEAADLDIIDRSISNAASMLKAERAKLASAESDKENCIKKLEQYDWIDNAESDLKILEIKDKEISDMDTYIDRLDALADGVEKVEENIKLAAPVLAAELELKRLVILDGEIGVKELQKKKLAFLTSDIDGLEDSIEKRSNVFSSESEIERLEDIEYGIEATEREMVELNHMINSIRSNNSNINQIKSEFEDLEKRFNKLMPDECPLCGR